MNILIFLYENYQPNSIPAHDPVAKSVVPKYLKTPHLLPVELETIT